MQNDQEKDEVLNKSLTQELTIETDAKQSEIEAVEQLISENSIAGLNKKELTDKLTEYLTLQDINPVMPIAKLIKNKYDELVKEEYQRKLALFTNDGTPVEDFEPSVDLQDEKFNQLWKSLNEKKVALRHQKEKVEQENLAIKKIIIEELKQLLKLTKRAKLLHYKKSKDPELAETLMFIRDKLNKIQD